MDNKVRRLGELAALVGGELSGDPDLPVSGVADFDSASAGQLAFVTDARRFSRLGECRASALIVPAATGDLPLPVIRVRDPYLAVARIHSLFVAAPFVAAGIHERASLGRDCSIPEEVSIGPFVSIGNRVRLGRRVTLHPGVVLYDDVRIGDDAVLHANVTVYDGCLIGDRVVVHAGVVIGADGFGYAADEKGCHVKRPQVGIVQIEADVEIGANAAIDRATFGRTLIRRGAKIDNLVQIGHNVVVGEDSLVVAQVGIAGSSTIGRGVVLGGQVGIGGHLYLGDRVMVAAKSGVHTSPEAGAVLAGIPAIPHRTWLRASAAYAQLPEIVKELRALRKKVAELDRGEKTTEHDGQGEERS